MAITSKKKFIGQKRTAVLGGQLRMEDGNNRMVMFDGTNLRMILGVMPDGSIGLIISKVGYDVEDLFT